MEQDEESKKELDMLEKIYSIREEDLELGNKQDRKILKQELNEVNIQEIEDIINNKLDIIDKSDNINEKKEVICKIEKLIENYEIQIAYYSKKNYKQGFKDAFLLYSQCIKD